MARQPLRLHPHLFVPDPAASYPYTNPIKGRSKVRTMPRDRAQHAARIKRQLEQAAREAEARAENQRNEGIETGAGITISFEGEPGFDLKFESLDMARSGVELLSVKTLTTGAELATVFVPDGKLTLFLNKVTAYENENRTKSDGTPGKPKNEPLVTSISEIRVAALNELWTDTNIPLPDLDTPQSWEVWIRKSPDINHLGRLRERAVADNLSISEKSIQFIDRTVVLVHGTGNALIQSNDLLGAIAEVRLAKVPAGLFADMEPIEQQDWVDDLAGRLQLPAQDAPHVCLFDTGVSHAHPLLSHLIGDDDIHTYKPDWGRADQVNHGTRMAGLAVFGDLSVAFARHGPVPIGHRLESVKIINAADPHEPDLYGYVTIESANRVEITADRRRVYCMAVTATDGRDRGRPSSWSAAIDDLTSGRTDDIKRLMIVSAGNTDPDSRGDYPDNNMTDAVHDPAQSWNALTVGGFTEKAIIDQEQYPAGSHSHRLVIWRRQAVRL